jgi:hypothetical protein
MYIHSYVLRIKPRASYLVGWYSTIWTMILALLFVFGFWDRVSLTLPSLAFNLWYPCLYLQSSWDYRCEPPCPQDMKSFMVYFSVYHRSLLSLLTSGGRLQNIFCMILAVSNIKILNFIKFPFNPRSQNLLSKCVLKFIEWFPMSI